MAIKDRFGDLHLAATYRSQLKTSIQRACGSLQEYATVVEQLAHRASSALPKDYMRREAGRTLDDGV
jgi:hypothetical protein